MIYQSNLIAPDLVPHFKLLVKPRGYSFHHDVPSDPDFEPECGSWTHDEAAILYTVAFILGGQWLDIGCRFGWTSAHIAAAGGSVLCLDPILAMQGPFNRFEQNMNPWWDTLTASTSHTAAQFFERNRDTYDGFVIDGCHDEPEPLNDAMGCAKLAKSTAVIMLHDFWGRPVRDAVTWLMDEGWHARVYWTPNGVACCWRGSFLPPEHEPDVRIRLSMAQRFGDFDFTRTE